MTFQTHIVHRELPADRHHGKGRRMNQKSASAVAIQQDTSSLSLSFKIYLIWTVILFARPQDFLTFLAPFRIALLFTVIALAAIFFGPERISGRLIPNGIARKFGLLYLIMILGIPFANHRGYAFQGTFLYYPTNVLFFYLSMIHLDSIKKIRTMSLVLCLSILFYGLLGLLKGHFTGGRLYFGTMYDPNDLAFYMVGLFPISVLFLFKANSMRMRVVAACALAIAPLVIILTASRGGLVSLSVVLMILFMTHLGGIKRSYKVVILVIVAAAVSTFSGKIDITRFDTLFGLKQDYNLTSEEGRLSVWESAFTLIAKNPVTGVGVACFPRAFGYLRMTEGRIPAWKATHNSYLQIWTELGFPGIVLFLAMIYASIRVFWRTMKRNALDAEQRDLKLLSGLLLTGYAGLLVGAFFLSQGYSLQFTLFFALGAAFEELLGRLPAGTGIV
jgi:O-antigen ligase